MTEKASPPKRASAAKTATAAKTVKKASTVAVVDSKKAKSAKAVAPKAAADKAVSPPRAKPAAAPKRKATEPQKPLLDAGQRAQYISVAAYYIAERRGFQGSYELEDWTRAETEIDNLLRGGKLSA